MKRFITALLLLSGFAALSAYPVKITSWHIKDDVKRLNALHISVDYVNVSTQTIIVDIPNESKFGLLTANGFRTEILPDQAKQYDPKSGIASLDSRDPQRNYLPWADYITFLQTTVTQYPNICQLVQYGTTIQNRPMYILKISDNVAIEENEPEFRYHSSIHGNEVVGFDMCVRLIQQLTSQYGTNTRITNIVNNTELWICPMSNPDGYVNQQRYNAAGIDINRNFPMPTGNQHPDGETTQPETQAMMDFGNAHNINMSGMFHGGAYVVNYLWDYTTTVCPDNAVVVQGALAYADHNPTLHNSTEFANGITEGAEWYTITGSWQDWNYGYTDAIDYTLEIGDYWPDQSTLDGYWANNQESMLSLIEFVQKGVNGTVTNSDGAPLEATITVTNNAKIMHTDSAVGDYHRLLLPGTYTLTAAATGYIAQSLPVAVPLTGRITQNFVLAPATAVDFSGTVVNNQGIPVSGALVTLTSDDYNEHSTTNAQGHFSISGVFCGNYTLNATATGLGSFNQAFALAASSKFQVIVLAPPLYQESFESGAANWTLTSPWAVVTEGMGHVLTDSPSGNYANNANINAVLTNPINLQNITSPALSYNVKYALESGYDFLKVQGSINGTAWTTLAEYSGTQSTWTNVTLPLTTYANQSLRLRFRLESDNSINADGAYIDNISISGNNSSSPAYGDIDGNRLINFEDSRFALEYAAGNDPLPTVDPLPWETNRIEISDVDNDATVSAQDAFIIADKTRIYTGVFPAQGGTAYTFTNPSLNLQCIGGALRLSVTNPTALASLQLVFSADGALTMGSADWAFAEQSCLVALNSDANALAIANLGTETLATVLGDVAFATTSQVIHCTGFVNGIAFSRDISFVANDDNNALLWQNKIYSAYPNPFHPQTTLRYSVQKDHTPVEISIYNARGQKVKTLLSSNVKAGQHNVFFDGKNDAGQQLGNGIYFVKMLAGKQVSTYKLVMLK